MRNLSLLLLLTPLAACTSLAPPADAAPAPAPANACSPANLARYTGLPATDATATRMKRETGKSALRWVRPGMAVTMEFSEDRLTVTVNAANRVERASCS